ncbi:methylated-DNA--[protein]-cysteine S-methyltransferase [Streptomyces durbertensis]|uniref:methylated-DNA--[protein]-cysteine S-methyltransferase n=1 Tax=Streptomyces durbertensis TaxID=2448886 RepID=UPI002B217052|nr:methylated-DNA--[protein]-cysteine S-methyltransferase [Streptomyces durbertensis]
MRNTVEQQNRTHTVVDSPIGPLTLVATEGVLSAVYMSEHRHRPPVETFGRPDAAAFERVTAELAEYFAGERTEFSVPVRAAGTEFQRTVWAELRKIPYGRTITYGELAARIGRPSAARAVGAANGRNPVSVIVPCHRVVGGGGSLTGYAGGLARKERLLALERGQLTAG